MILVDYFLDAVENIQSIHFLAHTAVSIELNKWM